MGHGIPEGFQRSGRTRLTRRIGNGSGNHDREGLAGILKTAGLRKYRLCIQGVENRFDQQDVCTAFDQAFGGLIVIFDQIPRTGYYGSQGYSHRATGLPCARWDQWPRDKARSVRCFRGFPITGFAG